MQMGNVIAELNIQAGSGMDGTIMEAGAGITDMVGGDAKTTIGWVLASQTMGRGLA